MNKPKIGITGWGSISPLGGREEAVWQRYLDRQRHCLRPYSGEWGSALEEKEEEQVAGLRRTSRNYQSLDRTALLAMLAARRAVEQAGWTEGLPFGINIGSSRGATGLWEEYHHSFLAEPERRIHPLTSPTTTLGNIATWVAHHLGGGDPLISHSITCSTALHALLNGVVWIEAGRSRRFLVGGSEAPLTPFTIAQMKALRIYAGAAAAEYPCRAGDPQKETSSMVLGEGAACFCLEADPARPLAWVEGIGYGSERPATATSLSENADCLRRSMTMALREAGAPSIDVLITHTPGTATGDRAELAAVVEVFGPEPPQLTNNKWKIGHTLGASGALSLELAMLMLKHDHFIEVPYLRGGGRKPRQKIQRIMVNAAGFGGNAVSVILKKAASSNF